tara:strand:- start:7966 stop:9267 length:1302 start_codon:yes stop_codon:yes gene_type:complete
MAKRSEILQELANKQKDVEAIQAEMEQKEKDMKNAWLEQQPIRDHDDIVKDYAEVAKLNLTDARDGLSNYPKRYQIEGKDIPALIKEMRKFRRTLKGETKVTFTNSIDNLIKDYSGYLEKCIDSIYWIKKYKKPLKQMNYNEDKLIKLNSIHSAKERREIIDVLCKYWEAEQDIRGLPYGKEYSRLNKEMKTLKKQFTQLLKQTPISNSPKDSIRKAILDSVCETPGISSREIHDSLPKNLYDKSSPQIIAKLAKEQNITNVDGAHYKINDDIKKNIWAYTAAFIDSDGYITMDKNHNPRVGLVATGNRGKAFMLEMHKSLGMGRLHLDQKSPQDTRLINRLNFYSGADIKKLLTKCLPHFKLKKSNANVLLELIKIKKNDKKKDWYAQRKDELFKLMKYYNHSDNAKFDWEAWDIDIDGITKLEENSKMDVI